MFHVYTLKSERGNNLYIGTTSDLKRRMMEHNSGKSKSTKIRTPFKLVYCETYVSEKDAYRREHNLKLRARALVQRLEDTFKLV